MSLYNICTKNYDHMTYSFRDMVRDGWTDGQTDGLTGGQKKWHIEVGAPTKKTDKYNFTIDERVALNQVSKRGAIRIRNIEEGRTVAIQDG